mmetsp:Transcript_9690/g.24009  ORF Transcript_9690/g.24009 Transcript_9690/m.24009 type:complete len:318 (-) Transcript_9690:3630-4583(-)
MGVGAVASLLVADEVEHHRCGIGCVLESNHSTGGVYFSKIVRGGTAAVSGIQEGDEIVQVDRTPLVKGRDTVDSVSGYIRGKEGSVVTICVRKPWGKVVSVRLVRQRLPGSKAELLGALWQKGGTKALKDITLEDKLDVLEQLHRRGNLSENEYRTARRRLTEESAGLSPQADATLMDQTELSVASLIKSVTQDWARLTNDPALEEAKRRAFRNRGSISSDEAASTPRSNHRPATPQSSHWAASPSPRSAHWAASPTTSQSGSYKGRRFSAPQSGARPREGSWSDASPEIMSPPGPVFQVFESSSSPSHRLRGSTAV